MLITLLTIVSSVAYDTFLHLESDRYLGPSNKRDRAFRIQEVIQGYNFSPPLKEQIEKSCDVVVESGCFNHPVLIHTNEHTDAVTFLTVVRQHAHLHEESTRRCCEPVHLSGHIRAEMSI
jgi:hypothetical protein